MAIGILLLIILIIWYLSKPKFQGFIDEQGHCWDITNECTKCHAIRELNLPECKDFTYTPSGFIIGTDEPFECEG